MTWGQSSVTRRRIAGYAALTSLRRVIAQSPIAQSGHASGEAGAATASRLGVPLIAGYALSPSGTFGRVDNVQGYLRPTRQRPPTSRAIAEGTGGIRA
jgi:hypothetical protein